MMSRMVLLFAIGQLAIMSPGPDFFLVLRNALRCTSRAALATAWGISAGFCIHVSYCVLGVSAAVASRPELLIGLRSLGALYLIWIGIGALRSRGLGFGSQSPVQRERSDEVRRAFLEGLFCNLLNPKVALFLLGVFTQFIGPESGAGEIALLVAILVAQCVIYWSLLAMLIQRQRSAAWFERHSQRIDRIFGGILVILGIELGLFA